MRWLLWLVAVVLLIVAALAGVGHFVLANRLNVAAATEIERPRATVYALVSRLRTVQEWSPFRAMDPEAEYLFTGEDGTVGQSMRWRSSKRSVGDGAMTVLEMTPNERVAGRLELTGRAMLASSFDLTGQDGVTQMTWSVTGECQQGWINIPCRYMNLVLASAIRADLEAGLAELKRLAESLPAVDFETLNVAIVPEQPRRYIFDDIQITAETARTQAERVAEAMRSAEANVAAFFVEYQLTPDSRNRVVVTTQDDGDFFKFRVGYLYSGPAPLVMTGVEIGETPAGRMARVIHEGPRADLPQTYAQIDAYLQANRIERRGDALPWEVYVADGPAPAPETPDQAAPPASPGDVRVEIYIPIE